MSNDRRSNGELRRLAAQRAASDASRVAGEALDALLAGVAAGSPPTATQFLDAETRWIEARARERQAREQAPRPQPRRAPAVRSAPPASARRPLSSRGPEPTTQRSPRIAARREPQRDSVPPS